MNFGFSRHRIEGALGFGAMACPAATLPFKLWWRSLRLALGWWQKQSGGRQDSTTHCHPTASLPLTSHILGPTMSVVMPPCQCLGSTQAQGEQGEQAEQGQQAEQAEVRLVEFWGSATKAVAVTLYASATATATRMASTSISGLPDDLIQEEFSYGDHDLQTLTVVQPREKGLWNDHGRWIVYIHGGAWRDPLVTDKSIYPTIQHLLEDSTKKELLQSHIAGIASISYRLSPHPDYPQDETTPPNELRDAKHPDHLKDVLTAIEFLQSKYEFGQNYILMGHSCGATLALHTLMQQDILQEPESRLSHYPSIVVGVSGIYDMSLLCENHSEIPAYRDFTIGAFGDDPKTWDRLSPAKFADFTKSFPADGKLFLFHSIGDELIDVAQIDAMKDRFRRSCAELPLEVSKEMLNDEHDEIWARGTGMAKVVVMVLESL
ncbi:hypothetical protein HYFRA_00013321 [Hymenoscyphus fraxineus]|uniref:Kynurenine formamidase n=1 Tax=Hymenoscyphus fraxineus TaxID=746836 RepID=A0A9N9L6N4_9HELO|nr:hypothetical protein HYFRA_00013321 [Hymenoscyphus fraxineus]